MSGKPRRYSSLHQLLLARVREFYREPEAVFWVYGFPILMSVALGIAFRNQPVEKIVVDVQAGPYAERVAGVLTANPRFDVHRKSEVEARLRLRTGRTDVLVAAGENPAYDYLFDPTRPEGVLARNAVNDALQTADGRRDPSPARDTPVSEPGGRYIDFLIPGLLGMSLMGGGLWGVGFVIVDLRIRKLLKRFLATPMKKHHFLAGIMLSRFIFMVPEVVILLLFAWLVFSVHIEGSIATVAFFITLGALTFSGLGLLVASRAKTIESVSGLLNLVMLPMWILSGIFFSSDRFPEAVLPFIRILPLTPLNDALRAVMLEGASLTELWPETGILAGWGALTFVLALKWFRWK